MYASYHIPFINKLTRITEYSATLIDNIYTNNIDNNSIAKQGILTTDISDYLPIFHIIQTKQIVATHKYITKHLVTQERMEQFTNTISIQDWQPVLNSGNIQEAHTIMSLKLCKIFMMHFH